jgi:VanZ family protein
MTEVAARRSVLVYVLSREIIPIIFCHAFPSSVTWNIRRIWLNVVNFSAYIKTNKWLVMVQTFICTGFYKPNVELLR